ncbi:MAG: dienelactone hydrolase family protein, partial [Actinobacteria bacterium]|nr:dienelactone hydrolase family protein [Actinomycetota bacterium]
MTRTSLRVLAALAGALALHAVAQPTPDAEGALPDMPAARALSSAELGVQTVEIPRASMKDAEDAPQKLTAYWVASPLKAPATGAPVVIALHGCSGLYTPAGADVRALGSRYRGYAQWLG